MFHLYINIIKTINFIFYYFYQNNKYLWKVINNKKKKLHELNNIDYQICYLKKKNKYLWQEVLNIMYYTNKNNKIKNVYAIYNKSTDHIWINRHSKNFDDYKYNSIFIISYLTDLEKIMYNTKPINYYGVTNLQYELAISKDDINNYLLIETIDKQYFIGRFGRNDVEFLGRHQEQMYGFDNKKTFYNFNSLPQDLQKIIINYKWLQLRFLMIVYYNKNNIIFNKDILRHICEFII
jgi:hypothetical protein